MHVRRQLALIAGLGLWACLRDVQPGPPQNVTASAATPRLFETDGAPPPPGDDAMAASPLGPLTESAAPAAATPPRSQPAQDRSPHATGAEHLAATSPEAAPSPSASPAPSSPPRPGRADVDPSNDHVVAPPEPIPECEALLKAAGISYEPARLPVKKQPSGASCGAEQVVRFRGGPEKLGWTSAPLVPCGLALALARFERIANEEAERHLEKRIKRVRQTGTYNCRRMARFDLVSEHSYGNALDLAGFTLSDGSVVTVKDHFGDPQAEPRTKQAAFLRALARRLYDEEVFSVVLTPYWDRLHADHFHMDMARYRVDGTR